MAYLIALALLALVAIVASVWLIRTDGYRRVLTDPRRLPAGTDPAPSLRIDAVPHEPEAAPRRSERARTTRAQRTAARA